MIVKVYPSAKEMGKAAAEDAAKIINESIERQNNARIVLSTGASQFEFFEAFVTMKIDWRKVEVFHLDEYINMPETHPASFKKYLKERFLTYVQVDKMNFVNGEGDIESNMRLLTEEIRKAPIDLSLIGIGENTHIAFNDPPANFETEESFPVVQLDEQCRQQQWKEGWFTTLEEVPKEAITMSVNQIMQSKAIISCVPHLRKADAIKLTLEQSVSNLTPATILKTHPNWRLFLDKDSASKVDNSFLES